MSTKMRLVRNFGLLSIGNLSVKLLGFLLIPLYTYTLSTAEYGTYELIISTIGLMVPIMTLDIADSTLRFSVDGGSNKEDVMRVSLKYCLIGLSILLFCLGLNRAFEFFRPVFGFEIYIMLLFITNAIIGVFVSFAKGIDRVRLVAGSGVIGGFLTAFLGCVFLLVFQSGVKGLLVSMIAGLVVQIGYLALGMEKGHALSCAVSNKILEKKMIEYSLPLMINNIAWWVNGALDRFIIVLFCGISENGIYSIGYRIPTMINLLQSYFHQAWTISAIQEVDDIQCVDYYKHVYRNYNLVLVLICEIIIITNKHLARFLYANDFFQAWRYVPFLSMGFLFLGLSNFIGAVFNAIKKPRIIAFTTVIGAVINCCLNLLLIPVLGPIGAAIATLASYTAIWIIRLLAVKNHLGIRFLSKKDVITYIIMMCGTLYAFNDHIIILILKYSTIPVLLLVWRGELKDSLAYVEKGILKKGHN